MAGFSRNVTFLDISEVACSGKIETVKNDSKFQGEKVKGAENEVNAGPPIADEVISSPMKEKNIALLDNSEGASTGKMETIKNDSKFQGGKVKGAEKELIAGPSIADEIISSPVKGKNITLLDNSEVVPTGKTEAIKSDSKVQGKKMKGAEKELIAGPSDAGKVISSTSKDKNIASKNAKRAVVHPPISEMVLETLKTLKKRAGATVEQISTHIDENYQVTSKMLKSHINRFLKRGEESGVLEKVIGANAEEKFKIKKVEAAKKGKRDLASKKEKSGNNEENSRAEKTTQNVK